MKTGVFLSHINKIVEQGDAKSLDEALHSLADNGLECVDVDGANIGLKYNIEALKKSLDHNGIGVCSIFYLANFEWEDKTAILNFKEKTKRQFEYCAYLGTDVFMPVPNVPANNSDENKRMECQKKIIEYLNEFAVLGKEYGVTPVMENFSKYENPYSKATDFDVIFKNTSGVEYVLDTGNFWFCNDNFLDVYEKYHNITKHVHLKDITPNENGFLNINGKSADSNDVGSGIIDFPELFKKLKKYRYEGAVSIEICNVENMMNKVVKSLEYVNNLKNDL